MHHMYIYMATDRSTELHNNACVAWYGMGAPSSRSSRPPPRRIKWRSKHYVSVAMVGALVAIALVAAIFIILAPAHLTFSIAQANVAVYGIYLPSFNHTTNTHLNFTLTVNNSSPSTVVWYESMAGEVS